MVPTIGSLILNISSSTTRRISCTNSPDYCCNPRSHTPTYNDPTSIWDRALSATSQSRPVTPVPKVGGSNTKPDLWRGFQNKMSKRLLFLMFHLSGVVSLYYTEVPTVIRFDAKKCYTRVIRAIVLLKFMSYTCTQWRNGYTGRDLRCVQLSLSAVWGCLQLYWT